jgi:hypothetical protein
VHAVEAELLILLFLEQAGALGAVLLVACLLPVRACLVANCANLTARDRGLLAFVAAAALNLLSGPCPGVLAWWFVKALVKLRLCSACAYKLNYRKIKQLQVRSV